jgi:hypothetical protein
MGGQDVSRVEGGQGLGLRHHAAVLDALEVEIDELMEVAAMQQPQDFTNDEARGDRADEGGPDRLADKQGHAAAVESAILQQLLIRGAAGQVVLDRPRLPDFCGGAAARQGASGAGRGSGGCP